MTNTTNRTNKKLVNDRVYNAIWKAKDLLQQFIDSDIILDNERHFTAFNLLTESAEDVAYFIRGLLKSAKKERFTKIEQDALLAVLLSTGYYTSGPCMPSTIGCIKMYKHLKRRSVKRSDLHILYTQNQWTEKEYTETASIFR